MKGKQDRALFGVVTGLVLLVITIPYWIAYQSAGSGNVFGGFLVNPIDGHTYLAKMVQGAAGQWRFTLPYTAEPGKGAYLNLYYLALGHLAGLTGLPEMLVYHLARLGGALVMLIGLYRFVWAVLETDGERRFAFVLTAFGSGFGWLAAPFDAFTADFWVAEAYPFLSALTNPHFPLGLGILLWLLTPLSPAGTRALPVILGALALALVSPFACLIALSLLGLLAGFSLLGWLSAVWSVRRFLLVSLGGVGILVYDLWAILQDPILAEWNNQNLTASPAPLDLLISFSPALVLGLVGVWTAAREKKLLKSQPSTWLLLVLVLIYLPFNLQRRLLTGFYVPVGVMAAVGLTAATRARPAWFGRLAAVTVSVSVLTNVFILLAGVFGARTLDPLLYLTHDEAAAMAWIQRSTPRDALVLASPSTGLWIPSQTGRRVIYGHPFETVNAGAEKSQVEAVFRGEKNAPQVASFLRAREVDFVFYGPRERQLGSVQGLENYPVVYRSAEVVIYAIQAGTRD